jgi:hypothetical protein
MRRINFHSHHLHYISNATIQSLAKKKKDQPQRQDNRIQKREVSWPGGALFNFRLSVSAAKKGLASASQLCITDCPSPEAR